MLLGFPLIYNELNFYNIAQNISKWYFERKKNPTETIFLGRGKWRQKSQQCLNTTAVGRKTCAVVIIHDLSTSIYSTVYSMYMCVSVCPYISFPYSPSRDYIVLCCRQIELNQELNNCQTVLLYHCCGRMKQHYKAVMTTCWIHYEVFLTLKKTHQALER